MELMGNDGLALKVRFYGVPQFLKTCALLAACLLLGILFNPEDR
jgi:hypothetical protein